MNLRLVNVIAKLVAVAFSFCEHVNSFAFRCFWFRHITCDRYMLVLGSRNHAWLTLCFSLHNYMLHIIYEFANDVSVLCTEMTWYVVYKGKVPGVYDEWEDCRKQVHGFCGNSYKGYNSREEAEARYMKHLAGERKNKMKTSNIIPILLIVIAFLLYVIIV